MKVLPQSEFLFYLLAAVNAMLFPDLRFALFSSYNVTSPNSSRVEHGAVRDAVLRSEKV